MQCPNCETENRDGAKFCDECGFPLPGGAAQPANDEPDEQGAEQAAPEPDAEAASGADGDVDATQMILDEGAATAEEPEAAAPADATVSIQADLAGFDLEVEDYGERMVSPGYQPPEPAYRDGSTMQMPRVDGSEAPKSKEYRASNTTEQKKRGKTVAVAVVAVAAVAVLAAFGTYHMQLWGGKVVPDVVGMTEADARSVLADEGFATRSEQVKSDDTEGLVLIADPAAGERAEEGSEVVIHIATTRTVPEIVGKSTEDAQKALAEAGYENVKVTEKSSDKKKGTVLSVSPKEGERAKSTAEITVKVAKPYTVPDVAGKGVDGAIAAIEKAGLGYEVVYYDTSDYPEGTTVSTDPAAGTEVKKGAYIVLNVAQARGSKLEELASAQLGPGMTVESGGKSYVVESLDSVAYLGNNTVSYTATAREYVYVFGSAIQNPSTESISGTVVFDENDEIVAIS